MYLKKALYGQAKNRERRQNFFWNLEDQGQGLQLMVCRRRLKLAEENLEYRG